MDCSRIDAGVEVMLDPDAPAWSRVPAETVPLGPTPLANQPSEYVKASRDERSVGKVKSLEVRAAHDDRMVFIRLAWQDPERNVEITDNDVFPDGCGVLMPIGAGDTPIDEMGSKDVPVNAWFWRADRGDRATNVHAAGLGSTQYSEKSYIQARGAWRDGTWTVVFARPFAVHKQKTEAVQLAVGGTVRVGFAVWEGANGERGGLKAFSKEWRNLVLQA